MWRRGPWIQLVILATFVGVSAVSAQRGQVTAHADAACPGGAVLNVVAHPDDDLFFLSSDLLHSIATPGVCVRTVYVTAGDAGGVLYYVKSREAGDRAAYAEMAGVSNSWTLSDAGIAGHPISLWTLDGNPGISLEFMRLPDGNEDGSGFLSYNNESLQKLYQGTIPAIHAIDGTSSYTAADLTNTITTLMNLFGATEVRTMDFVGTYGGGDHSDHYSVAYFARAASRQYRPSHPLTGYEGYGTDPLPANLSTADTAAKEAAYFAYAPYDDAMCQTEAACFDTAPQKWWARQYTVGSELDGYNNPPVANAGPDQSVHPGVGLVVTLDGSASSDPDGDAMTYLWTQTSGTTVTLSDPTAIKPTFTAPSTLGTIGFSLTVTDTFGAKGSDAVNINLVNHAPKANAGPDQTVRPGAVVTLDGSASSDPDGDAVSYLWKQTSGTTVTLSDPTAIKPTFTAPSTVGTVAFSLTVTDTFGAKGSDGVNINVVNHTPNANPGKTQTVLVGSTVTLNGTASTDADGDPLTYLWKQTSGTAVTLSSPTAAITTFKAPSVAGTLVFTLTVTDPYGASNTQSVKVNVTLPKK